MARRRLQEFPFRVVRKMELQGCGGFYEAWRPTLRAPGRMDGCSCQLENMVLLLSGGGGCGARGRRLSPLAPLSTAEILGMVVHDFSPPVLPFRFLRMDSPFSSMRWALCTSRSRMLSAMVGSPIWTCQEDTGNWLVSRVECA